MGIETKIAWTRSTFNPWIGCTKVGPGCDHCYAEAQDRRFAGRNVATGQSIHWGQGAPRRLTGENNWYQPFRWDREAQLERAAGSTKPWLVFCASQADVFDNEVDQAWRDNLWKMIEATRFLTWQIVTKRVGNVMKMVPMEWRLRDFPPNVWILATIVNQEEANRDVPKLVEIPAVVTGISHEPALGPVDWHNYLYEETDRDATTIGYRRRKGTWLIQGGESIQHGQARPFALEWAESNILQCRGAGAPVFTKQMGSRPTVQGQPLKLKHAKGEDPSEWPTNLRVREFPI